jgi:TonB family protein
MVGSLLFSLLLSWVQVSSDTYIVKSSAGEERAKRVLKELEDFHQLVGSTLVFRNTELPELPIEVLLIGDEETLKELAPEYNGRKIPVAGYFQAGMDRDFIVLSGRVFPDTLTSVVYHELTHYFLRRGLKVRPTWLNEGLAEYFATAEIRDDEVSLGAVSQDRLQLLKTSSMLSLKEFFAVDSSSPHYNESSKSSVFYAQAWAFLHYLMHGEHSARFKQYLTALQKGETDLLAYLKVSERDLDQSFQNYVRNFIQRSNRTTVKIAGEEWDMHIESIPDTDAQMSIAEIFLANGKVQEARNHLEILATQAPDSTRVSYYRGILARIANDPAARDFFVDALLDPFLAPRAAVQLVGMGEEQIPAIRQILEEAADARTRNPEVYLALARIHEEELRRLDEAVRLKQKQATNEVPINQRPEEQAAAETKNWVSYMRGGARSTGFELKADSDIRPRVSLVVEPYYPAELRAQGLSGEVVVDVQVTNEGKVGGIWLVSSTPEVFSSLATASIRQWEFEPVAAKIRVVLQFNP